MAESKVGIGKASRLQHSSVPTDWSELPKDILQPIYQKLDSDFYQLRFRSVCSSWRSSSIPKNHLLNFPSKCPLPLQCKQNIISTSTYPLSKRTIFLINPPPNQQQTLTPWLVKIGPDDQGRTRLWNPLSRYNELPLQFPQHIDFNHLSVFHLAHEYVICNFVSNSNRPMDNLVYIKKVVALHNGNGNNPCSFLLAIHMSGKLAVFRSSDEQWMMMPEKPPKPYTDVCVFNGRSIAVDSTGRTVAVRPDLCLDLVAEAVFGGGEKLLVESHGELLLVDKYLKPTSRLNWFYAGEGHYKSATKTAVARFVVFRLDEKEKKWVELTNLGDRVLILGDDCAFSALASDLCIGNGNCVIFRDDMYRHVKSIELEISVFCLDKQQILPLSDLPCSKLFWPPPQWTGLF